MRRLFIVVAGIAVIAGCSNGGESDEPAPAVTVTVTATPRSTPTPTPSPTSEPEPEPALGTEQETHDGGTAAVLAYEQPVAESAPQPADAGYPDDYEWGAADVRVCVPDMLPSEAYPDEDITEDQWYVSPEPWSLIFADDSVVPSTHTTYGGFPQPEYPFGGQPVSPGQCVRGWIVFPVPSGTTPISIQYAPASSGLLLTWDVVTAS